MNDIAIRIEDLSKLYRLGEVGTGTISHDLNRWLAKVRGKEDPFSKIGQVNDRTQKAESDFVWALKDINLEIKKGDVVGIIGRNGAGKSTLLKIISRITSPSTGSIHINGRIAALLEVGTGMHPEMTARENIYVNGAILGMRKHEITAKFDDIVDFAGIAMYVDTPIKRFSSGMGVRLGFAVAAFLDPEILIVDEVLAVGDAEFQKRAIGKMQDVSKGEGRTVLFVSHNMSSITTLCKSGIVMNNGTISSVEGSIFNAVDLYQKIYFSAKNTPVHIQKEGLEINSFSIFSSTNNVKNEVIISGNTVVISALVECVDIAEADFELSYEIFSISGHPITMLSNKLLNYELPTHGKFMVECIMHNFTLNTGDYYIDLVILNKGIEFISQSRILEFEVLNSDYYGNQNKFPSSFFPTYLNQDWNARV